MISYWIFQRNWLIEEFNDCLMANIGGYIDYMNIIGVFSSFGWIRIFAWRLKWSLGRFCLYGKPSMQIGPVFGWVHKERRFRRCVLGSWRLLSHNQRWCWVYGRLWLLWYFRISLWLPFEWRNQFTYLRWMWPSRGQEFCCGELVHVKGIRVASAPLKMTLMHWKHLFRVVKEAE